MNRLRQVSAIRTARSGPWIDTSSSIAASTSAFASSPNIGCHCATTRGNGAG